MPVRSIVVGYDGSEHSDRALERAREYGDALGARLVVVTGELPVVATVPPGLVAPLGLGSPPAVMPTEDALELAEDVIERAKPLAGDRAAFVSAVGDAVSVILKTAEQENADLIVVGTHEPGFLERFLEGSVSEEVTRKASCDVLVVH